MSGRKLRVLALSAALTTVAALLAMVGEIEALMPVVVGGVAGTVALAVSPVDERAVPNHPLKLPFFIVVAVLGVVALAVGLGSGNATLLVTGVFLVVVSVPAVMLIRRGENPWWLRGWLDYRRGS